MVTIEERLEELYRELSKEARGDGSRVHEIREEITRLEQQK